jgi:hypothetical protein
MQQTDGVAVLATHLAQTDRRTLSQAWYSALHLAADAPRTRTPAPRAVPPAPDRGAARTTAASESTRPADGAPPRPPRGAIAVRADARRALADVPERRAAKTAFARTLERGIARRAACGQTASFVVRGANGRVQLVVRTGAGPTRVVAICAPPMRERVERALAHARFTLAGFDLPVGAEAA